MKYSFKIAGEKRKWLRQEGFTLVEILVVIVIIAVLSSLAVNGYLDYRKRALLDLTADNLISQIHAVKSSTVYRPDNAKKFADLKTELEGGIVADGDEILPLCYGLYFLKETDRVVVKTFAQVFDNKQEWNSIDGWIYKGCGEFDVNNPNSVKGIRDFELDKQINITELTDQNDSVIDSLVLRFIPPNGELQVKRDLENFESDFSENSELSAVNFLIQFSSDIESARLLNYNLINGNATY